MTFGAILMAAAVAAAAQPSPRPVAAVGDAAMTCRAGRVQSLAVGADLLINVELDDKSSWTAWDDRKYGTDSGHAIYGVLMSAFLSGSKVEVSDTSGYRCESKRFDGVRIKPY